MQAHSRSSSSSAVNWKLAFFNSLITAIFLYFFPKIIALLNYAVNGLGQ